MRSFSLFSQTPSRGTGALRRDLSLSPDECNQMVDFLGDLVRVPSVSGEEGAVAALIADYCHKHGLETQGIDVAGNLLIQIGAGAGPTLLYDAHMDTVSPPANGWPHPPFEAVIQKDVLYGMGACDTKASIAAMIAAGRKLCDAHIKLGGNLLLAFVVQEEPCEGCGLKALVDYSHVEPDWVVLGEPTNLGVIRGNRGRVLFKVTVNGRSSHASKPDLGDNAVTAAARLIFGIELLAADLPTDPVLGVGTVAVTRIESQAASMNAIPHTCTFYVDRRLTLGETSTRAQAQIESMIQREGIEAVVSVMDYRAESYSGFALATKEEFAPWILEETHPLVHAASRAIKTVQGRVPHIGEGYFSTDGVYSMGVAGIPTIGFGPGDPKHAHTSLEQVRLADVTVAAQSYALLAATLLGEG